MEEVYMADTITDSLPWFDSEPRRDAAASETTPGGREETKWVKVVVNVGPGEAAIIKGRLESEDIPAIVQQEAMGTVLGLTVGPLGSANVLVPEPLAEHALAILAETFEADEDDEA
jgi:hypothetical protein